MLIDNTRPSWINTDYKLDNNKPLTEAEVKAKILEVQTENIQAIQDGIEQNSSGWGDSKVKIKVPADANGKAIQNPTAEDWQKAAKNNRFVETEGKPAMLAYSYYGLSLADFGNVGANKSANGALLQELRDALAKGITFPSNQLIPVSEAGDVVRAFQARQRALSELERGIGNPNAGVMDPPRERVEVKVPADAEGKPIKNPSTKDWIEAQKNNRWATVSGKPADLASDYYGLKIDTANWRDSFTSNKAAFKEAAIDSSQKLESYIRAVDGGFSSGAIIDIPNAGKIIAEVLAVLGPAYNTELKKANELREQMDALQKKNDAITKFENTLDINSAGYVDVTIDVPKTKYVYDSNGNKVLDANGNPKTEPVGNPLTDQDWSRAAEFETVTGRAKDLSEKYIGVTYATKDDHKTNLSTNSGRFSNARQSVSSEMSKLSGQFDFRMGNAQTNLSNANKTISSINDMLMSIIRGI